MSHRYEIVRALPTRLLASALVAVLGLDARVASAAITAPAAAPEDAAAPVVDEMLDVMVDEDVARAEALRERIVDDTRRLLRAHRIELGGEHRVRLTIGVGGTQQAFRVNLGVFRDGGLVTPAPAPFTCECTLEELRARIDQGVVELLPVLAGESDDAAEQPEPPPPAVVDPSPPSDLQPRRRPLGRLGKAGVGVLSVGAGAAIAGAVLVAMPRRIDAGSGDLEGSGERTDLRPPGIAILGIGLGVLVAGAVMLGIDRARARRGSTAALGRRWAAHGLRPALVEFTVPSRF